MILPRLRISVIIPAYNEADTIGRCLDALARQSERPFEVLVVDNNSTDRTAEIAAAYPFVRVVRERRQGKAYAREAGFRVARGDVLARIDADSLVRPGWAAALGGFMAARPETAAVTGKCYFYDLPFPRTVSAAHAAIYHYFQRALTGAEILWGANMAIRRETWAALQGEYSMREDVDEDIDMTFLLHKHHYRIERTRAMQADVSALRGNVTPGNIAAYLKTWPEDYRLHGMRWRARFIQGVVVVLLAIIFIPVLVLAWARRR